jgi:glycosyltransferase involved in cell wall biosynthesis
MKVLHIFKIYYPDSRGGIEKCIESLTGELVNKDVESAILTTTLSSKVYEGSFNKMPVYYFPQTIELSSCPFSFLMLKNFKKIAEQYDILHYHFPWPFADFLHLCSRINKPTVLTYHSDIVKQKLLKIMYAPLMNCFLKRMNRIVATSENYVHSSPVLKKFQDKVEVIPLGVNSSLYPVPSEEKLGYWKNKVGDNFFLFVGVLRYYKGLEFLLAAIRETNIKLVVVGTGPEEEKLKRIAEEHHINNVIFVGSVEEIDKMALYQLCKAVVVPSHLRSEAFCLTLVEGLMCGKPLISTEIGTGTSFVNQHDVSGLVVSPENPQALRVAMEKLLNDVECYERLKAGAQQRYHEHFTGTVMAESYKELYETLL